LRAGARSDAIRALIESMLHIKGTTMIRSLVAALAFATLTFATAQAQEFTAAQRAACKADYEAFCKGTMPGGGRVLACLSKHNGRLSPACRKVVADARK
jgi:hypothetical protein